MDYRVEFSKWWVTEFKTIKFPSHGTVFDYYIDPESKKFEPWSKMVPKFEMDADTPLQVQLNSRSGRMVNTLIRSSVITHMHFYLSIFQQGFKSYLYGTGEMYTNKI